MKHIKLSEELHKLLKIMAAENDETLEHLVEKIVFEYINKKEVQDDN